MTIMIIATLTYISIAFFVFILAYCRYYHYDYYTYRGAPRPTLQPPTHPCKPDKLASNSMLSARDIHFVFANGGGCCGPSQPPPPPPFPRISS